jgi:phage terminase large subunit-like protein
LETAGIGEDTLGPLVVEWARKYLGVELFPWQKYTLDRMLATTSSSEPEWNLFHRESFVGCGRQQGKTVILASLIGWWITEFARMRGKPQNVLNSAHKLHRAEEVARYLFPILEEYFGAKPMWSAGRMSLTMPDRSKWEVTAAVPSSAHGGSYDLIAADEIWHVAPTVVQDGYKPSQLARRSPLLAMFSTAGTESSTLLLQIREQGLANIDAGKPTKSLFMEWSVPPSADPFDERYWKFSNPSLGHGTITLEALRDAAAGRDKESFIRGHANMYLSALNSWLPTVDAWQKCQIDEPILAGGVLAIEQAVDAQQLVGTRARAYDDGTVGVTVAFVVDNEETMWTKIREIMEDRTVKLAGPPSLELHVPEELRPRWTTVGHGEIIKWTSLVRSMIAERRVKATREEMFAQHVSRAVGVKTTTGYIVSSQKSPGPIELCRTMIWSVALASVPQRTRKPQIGVSRK